MTSAYWYYCNDKRFILVSTEIYFWCFHFRFQDTTSSIFRIRSDFLGKIYSPDHGNHRLVMGFLMGWGTGGNGENWNRRIVGGILKGSSPARKSASARNPFVSPAFDGHQSMIGTSHPGGASCPIPDALINLEWNEEFPCFHKLWTSGPQHSRWRYDIIENCFLFQNIHEYKSVIFSVSTRNSFK